MKKIIAIICLVLSTMNLYAKEAQDSLLLKINKRDQTLVGTKAANRTLRQELEMAFDKKGLVLTDSLWQNIRQAIKTDSDGDSSISVRIGNSSVKIGIFKSPLRGSVDSRQSLVRSRESEVGSRESERSPEDGKSESPEDISHITPIQNPKPKIQNPQTISILWIFKF